MESTIWSLLKSPGKINSTSGGEGLGSSQQLTGLHFPGSQVRSEANTGSSLVVEAATAEGAGWGFPVDFEVLFPKC